MREKNREYLMLAHRYDFNHNVAFWLMSEKLDGMRAFWDGGISRGTLKSEVPWGNTARDSKDYTCTGLWSRYGNVIHAPDWFLNKLPSNVPLDGELYHSRLRRQDLMSAVKQEKPDERWRSIPFNIFDSPTYDQFLRAGRISGPNLTMTMQGNPRYSSQKRSPVDLVNYLPTLANDVIHVIPQTRLTLNYETEVREAVNEITDLGGEGVILRSPYTVWEPYRTKMMLKVKKLHEASGVVTGYKPGKGKHVGKIGAIIVDGTVHLGGLTDHQRRLDGDIMPEFPLGTLVTYKYRTKTRSGKLEEAVFWHKNQ